MNGWGYCWWIFWIKFEDACDKKTDGRESNTAKGVSIATEFIKFKDVSLIKKLLYIKWKESKQKNIK